MAAALAIGWGRRRKRSRDLPAQYGGERYLRKLLSFDPLALWPLRGDGYDRSGNGYHGSSVNAVFEAGSGVDGRAALYFNGSTAYFDVYSAALAAAFNGDELCIAGAIRGAGVPVCRGVTVDVDIPAEAEIVLEGYVEPDELRVEGPFGDHTGYYSLPDRYPVFHLTAITHRKDAVYPATIVGIPPMEDFYIGGASVKLFLPIFKMNFPEIVDIALPAEGVFHNLVFVSIKKTYPMQAYKIMHGLWGMGQMMFTKYIIVVDDDVDVHNTSEVLFRLCANTDPQRDSIFTKGPSDVLDHATSEVASGSKLGIDATKKLPGEGFKRPWPPLIKMDEAVKARVDAIWQQLGL